MRLAKDAGRGMGAASGTLEKVLKHNGFEPRSDGDGGIVLGNCPFHRLAQRHTDIVCHLNLELLRGAAEGADHRERTVTLDPEVGRAVSGSSDRSGDQACAGRWARCHAARKASRSCSRTGSAHSPPSGRHPAHPSHASRRDGRTVLTAPWRWSSHPHLCSRPPFPPVSASIRRPA